MPYFVSPLGSLSTIVEQGDDRDRELTGISSMALKLVVMSLNFQEITSYIDDNKRYLALTAVWITNIFVICISVILSAIR